MSKYISCTIINSSRPLQKLIAAETGNFLSSFVYSSLLLSQKKKTLHFLIRFKSGYKKYSVFEKLERIKFISIQRQSIMRIYIISDVLERAHQQLSSLQSENRQNISLSRNLRAISTTIHF